MERLTKEGDSPVSRTLIQLSNVLPSITRNEKPCVNQRGPSRKAKYSYWPIVKKYREGKVKRTPGGEWNRYWNCVLTSRQSVKSDGVPIGAGACELFLVARLSESGAEGKPSLKRAKVARSRHETWWSIPVQDEARVKPSGGPNPLMLKYQGMRWV